MIRRRWSLRVAAGAMTAATVMTLGAGVAGAQAGRGEIPPELRPRMERACERVPRAQERVEQVLARLRADASVPGSLAFLEARIERARAKDRTQLVTLLENRLAVRTAAVDVLEARQTQLADLAELCAELGLGG
jgi:hypothetical protein